MTATTMSESTLLTRLRAGDDDAFESLVREHTPRLLSVARNMLRCQDGAADAVQDAFVSAFKALANFEGTSSLATWLHRILVNCCLMRLRSQSRRRTRLMDDLLPRFDDTGHHVDPIDPWTDCGYATLVKEETRTQIRASIDELPEDYRTVIVLRDLEEIDTDQTAEILGLSSGAVKTRLHRARQALRGLLAPLLAPE